MPYTRRDFLKHGALFVALGLTAPAFLARAAMASDQPMSRALRAAGLPVPGPTPNPKNTLVVVQLGGGNDGLNTIVPIGDARYFTARPTLAIPREQAVVATKVFQPMGKSANERGLSRKHIRHSIDNSLRRLQLDYVDLYQIHRFDYTTPIEGTNVTVRPSSRRCRTRRSRRRSCPPSPSTPKGRAMTAESLVPIDLAQVDVRTDADRLPFAPPSPNTSTTWEGRDVLWLGPDEWLVVAEPDDASTIARELRQELTGHHHSVLDVSANRIVFELVDGLEALSSGCGLDLHPSRWTPGKCAQTLFGGAQVILHQRDERTTRVFVRLSFAGYFADLFATA